MKKRDFMLVRHSYDDHSYIDGNNDTSLTLKGIEIAKKASEKILHKIDSDKVIIRHSVKRRAKETAEIIGELLIKNNIDCLCIKDNGLTELNQGILILMEWNIKKKLIFYKVVGMILKIVEKTEI